ncbi:MAG: RNA polymerase sigma factor [Clostridia bacterium]|nr:RNA polymerase sigma factor [Clostridia bacterium]
MEDKRIIDLFFERSELALEAAKQKYGDLCHAVARRLLTLPEDAEECVSDTYLALWNTIPPQNPASLKAYICRLVRNAAVSRYRKNTANKRDEGITVMLSELSECVPASSTVEQEIEGIQLTEHIHNWLNTLSKDDRVVFVRRYWYGYSLREIAEQTYSALPALTTRMYNLRRSLKAYLEEEGVSI